MTDRDSVASVAIFPRFYYPNIPDILSFLLSLLQLPIDLQEAFEVGVSCALGDVETQRQSFEHVFISLLVVVPHIVKESLFVADVTVLMEVVVDDELA